MPRIHREVTRSAVPADAAIDSPAPALRTGDSLRSCEVVGVAGDEDGQPAGGLGRVALHGIGRTGISVLAIVLTQLVSTAILARLLSPAEFGVVAAANVAILFGQLISDLGLSSAVIRHVDLTPAHVRTAFTVSLLVGATLAAAVAGFADPIAAMLRIEASAGPLRLLAASFLWFGLAGISHALLHRALRFGTVALIDAVAALLCNGVLTVALALAGWGYWALATGADDRPRRAARPGHGRGRFLCRGADQLLRAPRRHFHGGALRGSCGAGSV